MFPIYDEVYEFSALLGILDRQIAKSFPLENDVFMKVKSMLTHLFSSDFPWLFLEKLREVTTAVQVPGIQSYVDLRMTMLYLEQCLLSQTTLTFTWRGRDFAPLWADMYATYGASV